MTNYVIEQICPHLVNNCQTPPSTSRYKSASPAAAAKKAANRSAREHGFGLYYISLRETYHDKVHRYKVRVLKATKQMINDAIEHNLYFIPERYARIEHKYT